MLQNITNKINELDLFNILLRFYDIEFMFFLPVAPFVSVHLFSAFLSLSTLAATVAYFLFRWAAKYRPKERLRQNYVPVIMGGITIIGIGIYAWVR
jgi:H+/Cl- antiporter ClcA